MRAMPVLAVVERNGGAVVQSSLEALAMVRQIAEQIGMPIEVVALPDGSESDAYPTPDVLATGLASLVSELDVAGVVAPGTESGMEVMAHLAAHLGAPLANNCVEVKPEAAVDGPWQVTRVRSAGVLWEDAELSADLKLVTLAQGSVAPADPADLPAIRDLSAPAADSNGVRLVDRTTASGGVTLTNAAVVVSGGRGVGSAEGFAVLEELAALTGGAVGCSRVVTNNGWRPHSDQVGQTGAKVAPDLYIAAGISGATQHWAGCMGSKTILAINTDPEAPMVTRADYAVIGDVQEVLHAVVDEVRKRHAQ